MMDVFAYVAGAAAPVLAVIGYVRGLRRGREEMRAVRAVEGDADDVSDREAERRRRAWDEETQPLCAEVGNVCRRNGVPFVAAAQLSGKLIGTTEVLVDRGRFTSRVASQMGPKESKSKPKPTQKPEPLRVIKGGRSG